MTSSLTDHAGAPTGDRPATGRPGRWRARSRLTSPGWALLPLRVFLGVTFGYAGVSKLLDPAYLDAASPIGVRAQMLQVVGSSPIGALVQRSADHPTVTGLAIAFGEIAVGIGALLGLFTRLAALGGVLLALSFYLTVSWTTRPYYFGADLGFAFAWTPLLLAGDGGVLAMTQALRSRAHRELGLRAAARTAGSAPLSASALSASALSASAVDPAVEEPVMSTQDIEKTVERRTVLRGGLLGTAIGAVVVGAGTVVAFARRSGSSAASAAPAAAQVAASPSGGAASAASSPAGAPAGAAGGPIAAVAEVPVGGSKAFTVPGGGPAVLLHPDQGRFTAFHAACTHKGCPVSWTGSAFQCPCHGATFSAAGEVTGGPAKAPLAAVPVTVADGQVRLA